VRDDLVDEVGPDHQHQARVRGRSGDSHVPRAGLTTQG
jgi:hypothetical protein